MAVNGFDVVLRVNTGTVGSPSYTTVASQTNVVFDDTTDMIDTSSKESRNRTGIPGRYSSSVTLDAQFSKAGADLAAFRSATRNGTNLLIRRRDDVVADDIEEATCIVSSMSESFPDQDTAVVSLTLDITGAWSTV